MLGFAVNVVTVVMIVVLGFSQKIGGRGRGAQRSDSQVVANVVILNDFEKVLENDYKKYVKNS